MSALEGLSYPFLFNDRLHSVITQVTHLFSYFPLQYVKSFPDLLLS